MRKTVFVLTGIAFIAALAREPGWPYLRMAFASSACYTEHDKQSYDYYTPELLKKTPRISEHYHFEFGRITGTEAEVFTVKFYGVAETQRIRNYLKSQGYESQTSCDVEAECWESLASDDKVTVGNIHSQKGVFVQIYRPL
ncbi:hypothetical protein ACLHDD_16920 [Pantoea sp. NSTU24]|uniref:hypothetical protein n=1 Tax=Pantoea sp. NSTU24 TaxID=3391144 RepID=UPI003D01B20E